MNRKQWLVLIGAMSLAAGAYCARPRTVTTVAVGHTVEGFLSDTGQVVRFDSALVVSICQLEDTTEGLDSSKRLCPNGDPKEVDIPTYPPKTR